MFYLLSIFCMIMYGIFLPFNYISSSFFIHSWYNDITSDEALKAAGIAMGIPFLISGALVPLMGYIIDLNGKRASLILVSSLLTCFTFILFLSINPIYGIITFGISYSLFAAIIWPAITLVVPNKYVGFALGLTCSLQNLSTSICPIIIAYIFTTYNSYNETLLFFIVLSLMCIGISCWIINIDKQMDHVLERSDPDNARFQFLEEKTVSTLFSENKESIKQHQHASY